MGKKTVSWDQCQCAKNENLDICSMDIDTKVTKKHLLLHSCCGPCSTACIERLIPEYKITVFFYNPNITDLEEYEKRRLAQINFINQYNQGLSQEDQIQFVEGEYLPEDFYKVASAYKDEPEGGSRCVECFKLRMERSAQVGVKLGMHIFGTTLTVSPHKNYMIISAIGNKLAELYPIEFLDMDFKKKAGFQRSTEMSKEYGLYRQNYCGCSYSDWTKNEK